MNPTGLSSTDQPASAAKSAFESLRRVLLFFREQTGESLPAWVAVAALSFIVQIIFRRDFAPGEFGTLNTVLAVVGLMTVPLLAVDRAFAWYLAQNHPADQSERVAALRSSSLLITETCGWVWGAISLLLLFVVLGLLGLPRFSLGLFTLVITLLALAGVVSGAVCRERNRLRFWGRLLAGAALARVQVGAGLAGSEPWAESGLAAFLVAGFITLVPALTHREIEAGLRVKALRSALDRDFLRYLGATFSVLLAVFLFSSADRLIAQSWFGVATNLNMGLVDWQGFDAYQTAGLLGRALLWGTQPLLLLLLARRSRLDQTTAASLTWFWIYLGALLAGAILLIVLTVPLSRLFCGDDFATTARFVPSFALAMVPLGVLQALGIFVLASRRFVECHVFGGLGVAYALLLYLVGRQAQLMPAYMFGGGVLAIMVLLFVGIVRWGRGPERILWNQSKPSR
jgi:hypothetical protein